MLQTIINVLKNLTYFTFFISFKTGQFLIAFLSHIVNAITYICRLTTTVLSVIGEDFLIFMGDVFQAIFHVISSVYKAFEHTAQYLFSVCYNAKALCETAINTIINTWNFVTNTFLRLFSAIGQICNWMKQVLMLVGSGMWFALTLIPIFIVYITTMITYYFGCLLEEINDVFRKLYNNALNGFHGLYNFVTDVPLESLAGLVTAVCILYVLMKSHIALYRILGNHVRSFKNYVEMIKNKLKWTKRGDTNTHTENNVMLNNCTICQERDKCILFLPCRHVSVCSECNDRLRIYDYSCPICRTAVKKCMKIYV